MAILFNSKWSHSLLLFTVVLTLHNVFTAVKACKSVFEEIIIYMYFDFVLGLRVIHNL